MTHTTKRKIVVNNTEYGWCIHGNDFECKGRYITIYKQSVNGQTLYLDPFPWNIEIRPKTVREAILFALQNNWNPVINSSPMYLGFYKNNLIVLPKGIKSTFEYQESIDKLVFN